MNHRPPNWPKLTRACVALAAAYALALQVALLSITAASSAMAPLQGDAMRICYGSGNTGGENNPSHSPSNIGDCMLSCAQGLSAAAVLPPDVSQAPVFTVLNSVECIGAALPVLSPRPSPKLAQGPPQLA